MSEEAGHEDFAIDPSLLSGHAVIAGFGIPGRAVADALHARGVICCVIEQNDTTVERCRKSGLCIIDGDASDAEVLKIAGLERATLFICTLPDDAVMLAAVKEARRVNPAIRIIARCRYVSSGIEATRQGADEVIVEEQAVAHALELAIDR